MRLPVRSEEDAFHLVVALVVILGLCVLVGSLFGLALGGVVFAVGFVAALVWDLVSGEPRSQLGEAEKAGHRHGTRAGRLLLVVANVCPQRDQFVRALVRPGQPLPVLDIVAPVLQSRTHFVTTDIDRETLAARQRLDDILACAAEHGVVTSGRVGDAIDPLAGITDELRRYHVDEVLVITHPHEDANWVEAAILEGLQNQVHAPIRELVVRQPRQSSVAPGIR
jgi:hypothetical protein